MSLLNFLELIFFSSQAQAITTIDSSRPIFSVADSATHPIINMWWQPCKMSIVIFFRSQIWHQKCQTTEFKRGKVCKVGLNRKWVTDMSLAVHKKLHKTLLGKSAWYIFMYILILYNQLKCNNEWDMHWLIFRVKKLYLIKISNVSLTMCSLISGWFISVVINVDINGAQMTHFHEIGSSLLTLI